MESKNKLLIIGAGGQGRVAADIALKMNKWQEIAFIDDDETIKVSMGIKVIGQTSDALKYLNDFDMFVAIGNNALRENLQSGLEAADANIPALIHPGAITGNEVIIGDGTVLMAGVVVNCCSKIGKGCIINTGSTVDHDNVIEDYVHISPGAHLAGKVTIGKGTWIGTGATVSNNIEIIGGCTIGAGAVVIKDINESGTYIGLPARKTKR